MSIQERKEPSADQTVSYCRAFAERKNSDAAVCVCVCLNNALDAVKVSRCNSDTVGIIHTIKLLPYGHLGVQK